MTRLRTGWMLLTIGAILSLASLAQAQGMYPGQGFSPWSSSPISPWMSLSQRNGGPVDNYHMFVQPQLQLNDVLQRQQAAIGYNYAGMNSLGREMTMTQEHLGVRPTGSASVFMYYSHYYPMAGAAGQRGWGAARAAAPARGTLPNQTNQTYQPSH